MKNSILAILCLVFAFSSCKKEDKQEEQVADMALTYSFRGDTGIQAKLTFDQANITYFESTYSNFPDRKTKTCTGILTAAERKELAGLINKEALVKLPEQSGCGGCFDGGTEEISIIIDGKTYVRKYDSANLPTAFKALAPKFRAIMARFKDCK